MKPQPHSQSSLAISSCLLTLLLACFLFACNSEEESHKPVTPGNTVIASDSSFKKLDTALSFSGFWVNEQYVEAVKKTRSPVKTAVPEKSCITIPASTLKTTYMVTGFHEGGEEIVFVKHGPQYELWDADLKNKREDVAILSNDKIRIGDDYFVRLTNRGDERPGILEELLFQGIYQLGSGSTVEFTTSGEVKGLGDLTHYEVFFDYADQGMQVDQLALGKDKTNTTNYGFRFNKDSLLIYSLKCLEYDSTNNICGVVAFDKPVYSLIRKQ